MRKAIICLFAILLIAQVSYAANKKITVTGLISINARGNVTFLTTSDSKEYTFESESKVGKKVWKVCDRDIPCTVTGTVDKNDIIKSVTIVKKGN